MLTIRDSISVLVKDTNLESINILHSKHSALLIVHHVKTMNYSLYRNKNSEIFFCLCCNSTKRVCSYFPTCSIDTAIQSQVFSIHALTSQLYIKMQKQNAPINMWSRSKTEKVAGYDHKRKNQRTFLTVQNGR